jgi:hypothetical protein
MTTALKKARAKLMRRPVGLTIAWVILEETGERIGALIPSHPIDRRSLKERKFGIGTQLRAELRRDRNPKFWNKAHVLGGWLADNVEAFHGLGLHDALKKLQEKSGVGCTIEEFDIPGFGKGTRTVAASLNFSDTDEGEFQVLWDGWIEWLRKNAWPHLPPQARDEVEDLISRDQQ